MGIMTGVMGGAITQRGPPETFVLLCHAVPCSRPQTSSALVYPLLLRFAPCIPAALSAFYNDHKSVSEKAQRDMACVQIVAKIPVVAAIAYKTSIGEPIVYPREDLGYAENLLYMLFAVPTRPYIVDSVAARCLETILILHMDHEQNASTSTVRIAGSSQASPYACVAAGIASLWGPAHGGANAAVIEMLEQIGSKDRIPEFVAKAKDKTNPFRLMGFGAHLFLLLTSSRRRVMSFRTLSRSFPVLCPAHKQHQATASTRRWTRARCSCARCATSSSRT